MNRSSGVLLHVSSLPGEYGCGSLGNNAKEFIDFLRDSGFSYWQVLPFCLPDEFNSPYKSYSAFSLNPFFIDLPQLFEEGLITKEELEEEKQDSPYLCEFDKLEQRIKTLKKASSRFDITKSDAFFASHPHSEKYCEFMAKRSANAKKPWQEWKSDVIDEEELRLRKFTEYTFFNQWLEIKEYANSRGIKIIGDVPIYVSLDSADVWENPELFLLDKRHQPTSVAGVPPDYFSEDGQLWGNPLYNWREMKKDSYKWWRDRIEFMCELFDGVRIDHFRGLESFFSIPAKDTTAKNGKWKKGPGMSLIKEIKKVAGDKLIIAEDLGDITPEVERLVENSSFPGMRVLQFGFLGDSNSPHLPHNYKNHSVAYTGTHDNNTLLGYVWELSEEKRKTLLNYFGYTGQNWDECYDTVLRQMLASTAGLVIFPLQDLLKYGSDTRLNTPGSCDKNWAFRITKEQLDSVDKNKFNYWNCLYSR